MNLLFLGTGTSVGIPMIGCRCGVCTSVDPRNTRRRSSLYVSTAETAFVIDTPPDFRQQMLDYQIGRCHAVLFTHSHADHIFGFDDIRRFNTIHQRVLPAYAEAETLAGIRHAFNYIDDKPSHIGLYRAQVDFVAVDGPFDVGDVHVTPLKVEHGASMTGYLLEHHGTRAGYVPDCSFLPSETIARLHGVDVMILDCLRYRAHPAHLNVEQSLAYLSQINAKQSYLIHLCHDVDHATLEAELPVNVRVSYDGLHFCV
ncbi:MAG: MBL fold metallo-hydrolase [Kiritimatiellaeota bacterium]|nr:MBL fold metallo-hydrolase [Kiritimatiellota bacterium]